jgi:hypothetical protein
MDNQLRVVLCSTGNSVLDSESEGLLIIPSILPLVFKNIVFQRSPVSIGAVWSSSFLPSVSHGELLHSNSLP